MDDNNGEFLMWTVVTMMFLLEFTAKHIFVPAAKLVVACFQQTCENNGKKEKNFQPISTWIQLPQITVETSVDRNLTRQAEY